MNSLFFWNDWKRPIKYFYIFLFSILIILLALYLISYFVGFDAVVHWEIKSTYDIVKLSVDDFSKNLFHYSVDGTNYLIREKYLGSELKITPLFSYIYFTLMMLGMLIALTVITRLELPGFIVGMGIFIFFIFLLQIETLAIFGSTSRNFTIISILVYTAVSFYFKSYDTKLSFIQRFIIFLAITIILAFVIDYGSTVEHPFLRLANFGIIIPIILTMIFIIAIGFDIITGFLFITSSTKSKGKNSILNFAIITGLYLVNLLLIYLKKKGILTSDFIYLDVFFIYIASAIVGIWGLKKRATLFEGMITFSNASFLYIAFAIISTSTLTFAFITANDPLIQAFQLVILYSHLGMGVIFFLYILYNFWELFYKNISAYDLMYAPRRMPFFMVRPLGIVIMISLFMQSNKFAYKLAKGGYYNSIADVYYYEGKLKEAKEAYSEGSIFGYNNLRSNYAMATILTKLDKKDEAIEYYKKALEKNSSEYAYANESNLYSSNNQIFSAIFNLRDGLRKNPDSGPLYNNIGLLQSANGMWDSTYLYLSQANKYQKEKEIASSNLLWFLARKDFYHEADSILQRENFENHLPYLCNKLAVLNHIKKNYDQELNKKFLGDSIIEGNSYTYLYNYTLNHLNAQNDSLIKIIDHYLKLSGNADYHSELNLLKAFKLAYSGDRANAVKLLKELIQVETSERAAYYSRILGIWAMEQDAFGQAANDFKNAMNLVDPGSMYIRAVALLEAGNQMEGLELIDKLKNTPNAEIRKNALNIIQIFSATDFNQIKNWSDTLKFQFMHFRKFEIPEGAVLGVNKMFSNEKFKLLSGAELMKYYLKNSEFEKAENIWNSLNGIVNQKSKDNNSERGEINFQYLRLLESKNDWKQLMAQAKNINLDKTHESARVYFIAVAEENLGQQKEAEAHYLKVLRTDPFLHEAFIKTAALYEKKNNPDKAYDILVEGITYNQFSAELYMAYTLKALKMNLTNYAEDSLDKIKELTSPQQFAEFMNTYNKAKAEAEKEFQQY